MGFENKKYLTVIRAPKKDLYSLNSEDNPPYCPDMDEATWIFGQLNLHFFLSIENKKNLLFLI